MSEDLALRHAAARLFERVDGMSASKVIMDFEGVKTITRSFAHEYLQRKKASKKHVEEMNVPPDVQRMLEIVLAAQHDKKRVDLGAVTVTTL